MIGEPDAGKPHVRFDEGVQETCDIAARLRPTLQRPRIEKSPFPHWLAAMVTTFAAVSSTGASSKVRYALSSVSQSS